MDQELKNQSPLTSAVQWQETAKAVIIWSDFHTTAAGKLASFEHIFWSPNVENRIPLWKEKSTLLTVQGWISLRRLWNSCEKTS